MRIAYLTSRLPFPPSDGGRQRAYHVILQLSRWHEVTVYGIGRLSRGEDDPSLGEARGLKINLCQIPIARYGLNALGGLLSRLPFQVKLFENKELYGLLARDVERGQVDLLVVHLLRMAEYVRPFAGIPRILDMVDSLCLHYHRMPAIWHDPFWLAARLDRNRVCRYEAEIPALFDWVLLSSPVDLAAVRGRSQAENLVLVPNGVDLQRLHFWEGPVDTNRIIFFGRLDYLPNADAAVYFARKILPLVRKSVSEAHFVVAGWNPPRDVQHLARLTGVTVRSDVPDVVPEVVASAVSVAPMRFGAGIQFKILESLALGVPVVATPVAAQPLIRDEGWPILIGHDAREFADHVAHLMKDVELRERARRAGRALVESRYGWEQALNPLNEILDQVKSSSRLAVGSRSSRG